MKKLFALILSCAMMLGLAATAFADLIEEPDDQTGLYGAETTIEGEVSAPTIKVTVPTSGAVAINPYGMEYTVDGLDEAATDKIISPVHVIKNESDVAISIDVSIVGTPAHDEVLLATGALKGTETTKSVFMYFEIVEIDAEDADPVWADFNSKSTNQVVVGTESKPAVKVGVHKMDAAASEDAPTFAAFHLAGDVASKSAKPWTDADTVSVVIAFTFNPVYTAPNTGSGT